MFNWLRRLVLRFLEWLVGESLPEISARVREKRQKEADHKAMLSSKTYYRTFRLANGKTETVKGDCETICAHTDDWAFRTYGSQVLETMDRTVIH